MTTLPNATPASVQNATKFRLVTRSDFDGLVCAVMLKHLNMIDNILFVHPKDMQDGKIEITSRGQAVGFLVNPRLEVTKTTSIDPVADVHNIPDLRPAFRIDMRDTATGENMSAVVVHLKSMLGGPDSTAPIRAQQAQILANELGPSFKGIIAGDWNTFLDRTTDLNPLKAAGFQIANPADRSSTQSMGGRLDGFLTRGLSGNLSPETINPFFKNPLITRGLSDHALLSTTLSTGK